MYELEPDHLRRALAILSLLGTSVAVACSDSAEGPVASGPSVIPGPTFTFMQQEVFNPSCALSGCHAGSQRPDLRAGNALANIVDVASSRGTPYITAGDPDNSYLYLKVSGASGISGGRMPRGRPALSSAVLDAMREWIESGAPNN